MRKAAGTLLGKTVAGAVRLRGRSGGQAMPGLVVETLVPGYLGAMLKQLAQGVVIITGTNGKTTTTKMVVEILRSRGLRVLTNPTGSNLTRGIISSISRQAKVFGVLPFDIAVFELDEAYARQFTDVVKPRFVLGLNASRDQLDRFGEVDTVARLIGETMLSATEDIVTNADDKRLSVIASGVTVPVTYFGVSPSLLRFFPRDDELVSVDGQETTLQAANVPLAVELISFHDDRATYKIGEQEFKARLQLTGQHNFQNAAAALALVELISANGSDPLADIAALEKVEPAFGRGQVYALRNGSQLQLNLVKNPASFRQGLASYVRPDTHVLIAINDRLADSRDMSWLWDVDFSVLAGLSSQVWTSGSRGVDMALRLQYDEVKTGRVEPDLDRALAQFAKLEGDKVVLASYTAMLHLHALLERKAAKL